MEINNSELSMTIAIVLQYATFLWLVLLSVFFDKAVCYSYQFSLLPLRGVRVGLMYSLNKFFSLWVTQLDIYSFSVFESSSFFISFFGESFIWCWRFFFSIILQHCFRRLNIVKVVFQALSFYVVTQFIKKTDAKAAISSSSKFNVSPVWENAFKIWRWMIMCEFNS